MKKQQSHGTQSSRPNGCGYKVRCVEPMAANGGRPTPEVDEEPKGKATGNNAGEEIASVVGCNVNNANASARTLNANNALSNSNNNYAGAFAVTKRSNPNRETPRSVSSKDKQSDNPAATGGQGRCDYGSLPFMESEEKAESNANRFPTDIWEELSAANHKRKLKNLKRFFINPEIVAEGVEIALKNATSSPEVELAKQNKKAIIERIIRELTDETYVCGTIVSRDIPPKTKDGKWRKADIYTVYDRCVMNVILLVIREKLENCLTRNVYSGVPERSIFSNTKKYCMANKIRHYVKSHPEDYAETTDIRHFYENTSSIVVLSRLFEVIVCPYTRRLLAAVLLPLDHLAIGSPLSQLLAMFTMSEMDGIILRKYKPAFYAVFGDNRLICGTRQQVLDIKEFEIGYLMGRYNLPLKQDHSLHLIAHGFRFCKYDYRKSIVRPRATLRRRAIKAKGMGEQHYCGYKGIFDKTDSQALQHLIEHHYSDMKDRNGVSVRPMAGTHMAAEMLENERIIVTDIKRVDNNKDSGYYLRIQAIWVDKDGVKKLVTFNNGSFDIKDFYECLETEDEKLPYDTHLRRDGKSWYFEGHHSSNADACEAIMKEYNIQI